MKKLADPYPFHIQNNPFGVISPLLKIKRSLVTAIAQFVFRFRFKLHIEKY